MKVEVIRACSEKQLKLFLLHQVTLAFHVLSVF